MSVRPSVSEWVNVCVCVCVLQCGGSGPVQSAAVQVVVGATVIAVRCRTPSTPHCSTRPAILRHNNAPPLRLSGDGACCCGSTCTSERAIARHQLVCVSTDACVSLPLPVPWWREAGTGQWYRRSPTTERRRQFRRAIRGIILGQGLVIGQQIGCGRRPYGAAFTGGPMAQSRSGEAPSMPPPYIKEWSVEATVIIPVISRRNHTILL